MYPGRRPGLSILGFSLRAERGWRKNKQLQWTIPRPIEGLK